MIKEYGDDHLFEIARSVDHEIDLTGSLAQFGAETHLVLPAAIETALGTDHPRKYSIGNDPWLLPLKRRYVVADFADGALVRYLQRRFADAIVKDLFLDIVIDIVCERARQRSLGPLAQQLQQTESMRPIVVLFTPRSGGTLMARLLNALGVCGAVVPYRIPFTFVANAGHPFKRIARQVLTSSAVTNLAPCILVNIQFLTHTNSADTRIIDFVDWVLSSNALVLVSRRTLEDQAVSLATALATDVWERWEGPRPPLPDGGSLDVDTARRTIQFNLRWLHHLEDLLPSDHIHYFDFDDLIDQWRNCAEAVASLAGRSVAVPGNIAQLLPLRLRNGRSVGG